MSPWFQDNRSWTLGNLKPGFTAAITGVRDEMGREELRLQELGFVPGTPVEVLVPGPTMVVKLGDHRLSLRKESAESVSVSPYF